MTDVGQLFAKSVGAIHKEIKDFVNLMWDNLQNLPAYTMLKEKLQEVSKCLKELHNIYLYVKLFNHML